MRMQPFDDYAAITVWWLCLFGNISMTIFMVYIYQDYLETNL